MAERASKQDSRLFRRRGSSDEEDENEGMLYYVSDADVDLPVLRHYINLCLDPNSKAASGKHPMDAERSGYFVRSRSMLSAVGGPKLR